MELMKKLIAMRLVLVLSLALASCAAPQPGKTQTGGIMRTAKMLRQAEKYRLHLKRIRRIGATGSRRLRRTVRMGA